MYLECINCSHCAIVFCSTEHSKIHDRLVLHKLFDQLVYNQQAHTWIEIESVPAELDEFWSMSSVSKSFTMLMSSLVQMQLSVARFLPRHSELQCLTPVVFWACWHSYVCLIIVAYPFY